LDFINPFFKVDSENNIFNLREKEYETILDTVKQILTPVTNLGFQVVELDLKEARVSAGELDKTLRNNLIIKMLKGVSEINLSVFIPKLVGNYIYINGRQKLPLFQLFDIPLVTRGDSIKLRTNVATIMIFNDKKEEPHIKISFLGKVVPLSLLVLSYYGFEKANQIFDITSIDLQDNPTLTDYERFLLELKIMYDDCLESGWVQDDLIESLGRNYSKYNAKQKGEDVIYALDLMTQVDPMSVKFFHTSSVMDEILYALKEQFVDDTLFVNKRLRCFEYMILGPVAKSVFDFCYANRTARQPKFNVNSSEILSNCNVSDIIQFDFAINPIHELTMLSRTSLLGPGGFKRENVPKHLRDIVPSMFGRMCPVDTPDRENCGILQDLIPNVNLDKDMRFSEKILENQPISIPVSFVPFLEHDDQTRLQMASSQMRQAIMLQEFDQPLIQSGCEGLYTNYTQFIKRAKKNGEVVYSSNDYIIVRYDDGQPEVFDIRLRKIYVSNVDHMNIYVLKGDKVKAGDILAESNFCKDGKVQFGKNLLTAVMSHYGNNYEDGIVISERLVQEKTFSSVHYEDLSFTLPPHKVLLSLEKDKFRPLPKLHTWLPSESVYAILKDLTLEDPYSVFDDELKLQVNNHTLITDVNMYANDWNSDIPEFRDWVEIRIEKQKQKEEEFKEVLETYLEKEEATKFIKDNDLDKFSYVGKYKSKKERINGIYFEVFGLFTRNIKVGDKIANRHGNKGVISRILPTDKMPKTKDGKHVDICINPIGIISRMNIGQLYELHLALSVDDLKTKMLELLNNKTDQESLKKYLLDYIKIIDNTKGSWYHEQFTNQIPETIDEEFIKSISIIQPPFESINPERLDQAMKYTGTNYVQEVFDPISKTTLENNVAVGKLYFFRMVHIAEDRLAARGIGAYSRRTLQPLGGRRNKGGQRCGEMETACLIAHGAKQNLFEFLTTKSDCIDLKNYLIQKQIEPHMTEEPKEVDMKPESVKLLNAYLTIVGIERED
jgi:hypothetical protein